MTTEALDQITKEVTEFFGLNPEELYWFKIENGLKYLNHHFGNDLELEDGLKGHQEFWRWWRELWADRDKELLSRTERKVYGFNYAKPLDRNKNYTDTKRVLHAHAWEFYQEFHYWRSIQFRPTFLLISQCTLENQI